MKRFLPFAVPLFALLAVIPLHTLWPEGAPVKRSLRVAWVGVVLLVVVLSVPKAARAYFRTEYDGATVALSQIAAQVDDDDLVLSDHFLWGTPLAFIHDKQVLDGAWLWEGTDPDVLADATQFLRDEQAGGRRVRVLTMSGEGAEILALELPGLVLDWSSGPIRLKEIAHHRNSDDFWTQDRDFTFRLYTWEAD